MWTERSGPDVFELVTLERYREVVRLDGYALVGEPGNGVVEEPGAGLAALVGVDLDVGEPGMVVDGDVELVPALTRFCGVRHGRARANRHRRGCDRVSPR